MKKLLAVVLSVAMLLSMLPGTAFAADTAPSELPSDISGYSLKMTDVGTLTYNGKVQNPVAGIEKDGTSYTLAQLTEAGYEVKYTAAANKTAQIDAGVTNVTIEPKQEASGSTVTGTVTGSYTITPKAINASTVTEGYMPPVVKGETITADDIKLQDSESGKSLAAKTDFTLTDVIVSGETGTKQTVTISGTNNYSGERTIELSIGKNLSDSSIKITTSPSTFTYNGMTQTFSSVTVYDEDNRAYLTANRDYVISYKNNINAGKSAVLVLEGRGGYAGTKEVAFEIKQRSIASVSIESIPNQLVGVTPSPVIKDTGITGQPVLKAGVDYTVECTDNNAAGTATLIVRANESGNYTGYITKSFNVRKPLNALVQPDPVTSYSYTGSVVTPKVTVKAIDVTETYLLNRDYVIEGGSNIQVGTYTYYIVGTGNFAGKYGPYTYTITPQALDAKAIATLSGDTFTYTGKAVEPYVTVTCGGRTLRKDVDYTVSYLNNSRIGTASVIVYGKGNYTGSITKTFRIVGKDLSSLTASLSQTSYNYDGLEKKPAVTLYDGTKKLTSGVDYTVAYRNNKNAGTGEVIITGTGNYGGTKTLTFRIVGKSQTVTTRYTRYTKTLKSAAFNLMASHDGDGTLVYKSSDPSVATVSSTGKVTITGTGKATITVSTTGNVKYDPASKTVYVTVKPVKPTVKVTSPAKKQIKVTITKVKGATKYQVKYGRNGVYYNKYITHKDNEFPKTSVTLKNRTSGKTYEIKVRAYKTLEDGTKVWGDWTTVKKIKAK